MQKSGKIDNYQEFLKMVEIRNTLNIKGNTELFLDYAEYSIKSEVDKGGKKSIKHKKRKDQFKERFLEAYSSQTISEKLEEYIRIVKYLKDLQEGNEPFDNLIGQKHFTDVYCLSYNLHLWKKKELRLDMTKGQMFCEKDHKIKFYDLKNYLIRESKNTDYKCFVLEAINTQPHHKSLTVRMGFKDANKFKECFQLLKGTIIKMERLKLKEDLGISGDRERKGSWNKEQGGGREGGVGGSSVVVGEIGVGEGEKLERVKKEVRVEKEVEKVEKRVEKVEHQDIQSDISSSIGSQNMEDSVFQAKSFSSTIKKASSSDSEQQIQTIALGLLAVDSNQQMHTIQQKQNQQPHQKKRNLDVFHQIVPDYSLQTLPDDTGYQLIHTEYNGKIYHHKEDHLKYKVQIMVEESNTNLLFQTLARVENYTKWNTGVEEVMIKSILKSENVAIVYQKHRAMSKIYRARDFVFMRHVFRWNGNLYFLDKSIENASYPPFLTIVRGDLQIVWGIIKKGAGHIIAAEIEIQNEGYINDSQNHNLSMLYLKGLMGVQEYLKNSDVGEIEWGVFDLNWDISNNKTSNKPKSHARLLESGDKAFRKMKKEAHRDEDKVEVEKPKVVKEEVFVSKEKIEEPYEIKPTNKKQMQIIEIPEIQEGAEEIREICVSINYQFDSAGLVSIPQGFLKAKYHFTPEAPKPIVFQEAVLGHPIWKGQWRFDVKNGGIIFINEQKISDQKGVIKFILSKIAKNLLSGKSVLNISLPVDIFGYESNLERLAFGMTYAPIMLEKAAASEDPLYRFKVVTGFGLTNSALYLSMEKPFNSILGETFQGWMNGCPIYFQQISHHPPIAAFLMLGRGYKMTGTLESKVEVHMNSGCGTNQGVYRIMMDDGSDYNFITPGGQISGISYGDRKFNLVGKYYVWSKKHRLFLQMIMDPCSKKGFLSKREHPTDYMEGYVKEVKLEFLNSFQKMKQKEREGPSNSETVRTVCKAHGTWYRFLKFENEQFLNLDEEVGCKLEYDPHLLPSDGNWREDLAYRRKRDIVRAQTEKQRLENLQRGDRKLREKFHKPKH